MPRFLSAISAVAVVTATLVLVPGGAAGAAVTPGTSLPRGSAWGAAARLEHPESPPLVIRTAEVGRVATQNIPCHPVSGRTYTNDVLGIELVSESGGVVLDTGVVTNEATPTFGGDAADSFVRSTIHDLVALGGLVTAAEVRSTAWTTYDATVVDKHTTTDDYDDEGGGAGSGTTFVDLRINGEPVPFPTDPMEPNREIVIDPDGTGGEDPIAKVVLNEQLPIKYPKILAGGTKWNPGIIVNGIHIYVYDFAGYSGSVVVAHAESRIRPAAALLSGYAFASQAKLEPPVRSGRQAVINLPCFGTNGQQRTIDSVGIDLPGIASSGTTHGTVEGDAPTSPTEDDPAYSESTETIEKLSLLGSHGLPLITADLIETVARTEGVSDVTSTGRVSVVNLKIGDEEVGTMDVEPNEVRPIPGLGFIRFNEQVCQGRNSDNSSVKQCTADKYNQITVRAIHLRVLEEDNPLELPVGAEIWIGVAHSDVRI